MTPVRNAGRIAVAVVSHSGEFNPSVTDLRWPGRGMDLQVVRSYRSALAGTRGLFGRGWFSGIGARIEREGKDARYDDGTGASYVFAAAGRGLFRSPSGFYDVLDVDRDGVVLRHRRGSSTHFERVDRGGRLLRREDRNGNTIEYAATKDGLRILDTLRRTVDVIVEDDLVREVRDGAGRRWRYGYDGDDRLVEVLHPATRDTPDGTTTRYAYDPLHRLASLTDAAGQTYLRIEYDDAGRVVSQAHGVGTHRFDYEALGRTGGARTTWHRRNGSTVVLDHDDRGHVVSYRLGVRADLMSPEDAVGASGGVVDLVTTSDYNRHGELVRRRFPAGDTTEWTYAEDDDDPRNRGNLLRAVRLPQPEVPSDHAELVTSWEWDPDLQVTASVTDPRGNTTSHRHDERGNRIATTYPPITRTRTHTATSGYNTRGQLLEETAFDGSVTRYAYHPLADPGGGRGAALVTDPERLGGYLARVTRDAEGARAVTGYVHDRYGNLSQVLDGDGNAALLQYNARGALERVVGRPPVSASIDYRYDENHQMVESTSAALRELKEYDALGEVTSREIVGADTTTERVTRDADGRIVRLISASGHATELAYDERGLLVERVYGAGTDRPVSQRFTYTRNGALRSSTDGNGGTTIHHYDAFHRHLGYEDPTGTTRARQLDAAGNVVRTTVSGRRGEAPLETRYDYDEWNRVRRADRVGDEGISSTVLEYAEDGRSVRLRSEGTDAVTIERDGLGRVVRVHGTTGDEATLGYDHLGNPISLSHHDGGDDSTWTRHARHDGTGRLVWTREGDGLPRRLDYDVFGGLTAVTSATGLEIRHARDARGRHVGHTFAVPDPAGGPGQRIERRFEYDIEDRLRAVTDAVGQRTTYEYDALGRQVAVHYPDRTTSRGEYDGNGNLVRSTDPNGAEVVHRYDAADRLVERRSPGADGTKATSERYEYDGVGRLVGARGPTGRVRRTYDSLSRVVGEDQDGRTLRASYDTAGHLTELAYPGGERVRRRYDGRGRVVSVETGDRDRPEEVAAFRYGAGGQVVGLRLGGTVEATRTYTADRRVASLEYRRLDDGGLVEGFRYGYDGRGRIVHEIQLSLGESAGRRFVLDDGHRVVREQHGVEDVHDPASAFARETAYDYFPEGRWRLRRDLDGRGWVLGERAATIDRRNRYRRLGDTVFAYDSNGNCVRSGTDNPGWCLFSYDAANRLVRMECFDAGGRRIRMVEYFYDALGRLVRKVVTDRDGVATEWVYVWAGQTLLEEYVDGVLARTYVHGIGSRPVRLTVEDGGRTDYTFVLDGRGLAAGLVPTRDPNVFAERYGYELTGAAFLTEIDGLPVDVPSRASAESRLNSILGGDLSGSLLRDWATGTLTGAGGRHLDTVNGSMLNGMLSLTGRPHVGVKQTMAAQMNGFLGMLRGMGVSADAFGGGVGGGLGVGLGLPGRATSSAPDMPFKPDDSLYGMSDGKLTDEDDPGEAPAAPGGDDAGDWAPWPGDDGGSGGSGADSDAPLADPTPPPLAEADPVAPPDDTSGGSDGPTSGVGGSGTPATPPAPTPADNLGNKLLGDFVAAHPVAAAVIGLGIQAITLSTGGPPKMTDPDAAPTTTITATPEQIEARLNGRKKPVNPNGGGVDGGGQLDGASPPPTTGGVDPTIALFDPDYLPALGTVEDNTKFSTAPIDYVQGYGPGSENPPPIGNDGGSIPNDERP